MVRTAGGRHLGTVVALTTWVALLVASVWWGRHLLPGGDLNVKAPPFLGEYRVNIRSVVPAAAFALVAVAVFPPVARRLRWGVLLVVAWLLAAAWAVLLAAWDGHRSLGSAISRGHEYLPALGAVGDDPGQFLRTYAEGVAARDFPVHVNGHPPLMVLVFWVWDRIGLSGELWAAALVIGAGSSAVVAVAITVRALGDEAAARAALPFLVLAPFAITVATSADAFFLGVGAWAAAALATGVRRGSAVLLGLGGLLAGSLPYLSYGLLPLGAVLLAAAVLALRNTHPPVRVPALGGLVVGLLVVPLTMTLAGFWWPDGVAATHRAWELGKGDDRPYGYSFLADFAILGVLVGPATAVAGWRRPGRVPAVLAVAALVGVLTLAVSGVTRLEVERIWLPYAPWMVALCAALPVRGRLTARGWLLANAACAVVFQALVLGVW